MLIRISLIIAIIAGLAVGGLNIAMVKKHVDTLHADRNTQRDGRIKAEGERDSTKKELSKTQAELKTTQETLASTTEQKDKALADLASQTKRAEKLTDDLAKTRKERDDAQAELAAYTATGVNPQQIIAMRNSFKGLQDNLAASEEENKVLLKNIQKLKNRLAVYEDEEHIVQLPPMKGKVLVADPKWNFVVVDVGESQGVLEDGELLINRNGRLVAKVKVRNVQKDRSIANVMPGWKLVDVMEGDQVIPAHPAS